MDGARRRADLEMDRLTYLAWQTANLTRAAKLPDLRKLLGSASQPKSQEPEALALSIDQLFLAWGGDPEALKKAREGAASS